MPAFDIPILQFCVDAKNPPLLEAFVDFTISFSKRGYHEVWTQLLKFNLFRPDTPLTPEMITTIARGIAGFDIYHITVEAIKADVAPNLVQALLSSLRSIVEFYCGEPSVLDLTKTTQNKALATLIKETFLKKFVETMRRKNPNTYDMFKTLGISQNDVSDYILKTAKTLPATKESINQIQEDIEILRNPNHSISHFLRTLPFNMVRNGLVNELEKEVKFRTAMLTSLSEGSSPTSRPTRFFQTIARPRAIPKDQKRSSEQLEDYIRWVEARQDAEKTSNRCL
jgi:hypothetical protein